MELCRRFETYYLYWWIKTYLSFAERHRYIAVLLRPIEALGYLIVAGWLSIIDMIIVVINSVQSTLRALEDEEE